jgi:AcrR family transcriptional regulator
MTPDTAPSTPAGDRKVSFPSIAGRAPDEVGRALLQAAHEVLAAEGPFGLTVRRVAQAAGVSTMNVYSRFGGKDGLIEQLFIDGFVRLGERMTSLARTDDPIADMRVCRGEYRQFALENPTYYAVMFDSVIPDWRPSEAAEQVAMVALGGLAGQIQRAIDSGQLAATDSMSVAISMWATSHGLISLEMRMGEMHGFDWPAIYDETLERLLTGFRSPPAAGDYGHRGD